jgi:CBS domain-containing protein
LPAGPTVHDEIANTAFFVGLMLAGAQAYGDVSGRMNFDEAKGNFFAAARHGLKAQFAWLDGKSISASRLILEELLPLARAGLKQAVDSSDIDKYLGVLEERVRSGQTGAQWMLRSFAKLNNTHQTNDARARILAATMLARQKEETPVHEWELTEGGELEDWSESYQTVGQFMSTDLFTLRPTDLVDLAASMMDWRHIRHVPVEDDEGRLVGLVTHRSLLRLLSSNGAWSANGALTVGHIMKPDPTKVSSTTPTLEAIELMRSQRIGCLPVVDDGQLVGIVTSYDFLTATARLFKQQLGGSVALSQPEGVRRASA